MADGITFDKASYKAGDKAVVTVIDSTRQATDTFTLATAAGPITAKTTLQAPAGALVHTLGQPVVLVSDDGVKTVYSVQY